MTETLKKFLYGETALLIRGLKDIAALCDIKDEDAPPQDGAPSHAYEYCDASRQQDS